MAGGALPLGGKFCGERRVAVVDQIIRGTSAGIR